VSAASVSSSVASQMDVSLAMTANPNPVQGWAICRA